MNSEIFIEPTTSTENAPTEIVTNEATARPDHIPEKFWDAEAGQARWDDLAKSYNELEKSFGNRDKAKPDTLKITKDEAGGEANEGSDPVQEDGTNPLTTALEGFGQKYNADPSSIGDDDIAGLVAMGVPQTMIDTYLAGIQALSEKAMQEAYSFAGDREQFETAAAWAGQNLSDAELNQYNTMVEKAETAKVGIEWLMAKYKAASPAPANEGNLLSGTGNSHGDIYESQAQLQEDIRNPKYGSDPAFREKVAAKMAASMKAGTIS